MLHSLMRFRLRSLIAFITCAALAFGFHARNRQVYVSERATIGEIEKLCSYPGIVLRRGQTLSCGTGWGLIAVESPEAIRPVRSLYALFGDDSALLRIGSIVLMDKSTDDQVIPLLMELKSLKEIRFVSTSVTQDGIARLQIALADADIR